MNGVSHKVVSLVAIWEQRDSFVEGSPKIYLTEDDNDPMILVQKNGEAFLVVGRLKIPVRVCVEPRLVSFNTGRGTLSFPSKDQPKIKKVMVTLRP